jgi:hypothetical protein
VNFAGAPVAPELPGELRGRAQLVISSDADRADEAIDLRALSLGPSEAVLLRLGWAGEQDSALGITPGS